MRDAKKRKGLPLQPTLVTVVVCLIVAGSGGVGVIAYRSSNLVVDELWQGLSGEIAVSTTQRTLRYLEPARPSVLNSQKLARSGQINTKNEMALLRYLHSVLVANPNFTWMSHSNKDGRYLAVYRHQNGKIRATWRNQADIDSTPEKVGDGEGAQQNDQEVDQESDQDDESKAKQVTILREYTVDEKGVLRPLRGKHGSYDPRERPWYRQGAKSEKGQWVEPFLFATVHAPGFMYVAQDLRGEEVEGVWAVEYEVSYLSEFLSKIRIGKNGSAYVLTSDGLVVGHPQGQTTAEENGRTVIAKARNHPDGMLRQAWSELQRLGGGSQTFSIGHYLAMAEPFPQESGIDWLVLVVVPEDDFFGPVKEQAWITAIIASIAALLAIMAGIFFSNRVSKALSDIAREMGRIGNFDIDSKSLKKHRRSIVREINDMCDATENMKSSLKSFGKYVPRELVRDLIRSGEEASLGGKKQEISVLFADVEGFTSTAETMDTDELVQLLGDFLSSMSEAVRQHKGTVDKYIGDAIMAFWGAPRRTEDHALLACLCALAMKRRLVKLQTQWKASEKPIFSARIGINTGYSVVGNFGSDRRMNYTAIGDAVNLSSRLESLNKTYRTTILIGQSTAEQLNDTVVIRPLDWVAVKGKQQVILIHELVDLSENISDAILDAIELYSEALKLYKNRDFTRAATLFDKANRAFGGDDSPSKIMADRSRNFEKSPPPDYWQGTFLATEK